MSKPSIHAQSRPGAVGSSGRPARASGPSGMLEAAGEVAASARAMMQRMILHELNAAERLLVLLWYAERMSPLEVALALDLTESQAVSMHDRIVARLRASLVGS